MLTKKLGLKFQQFIVWLQYKFTTLIILIITLMIVTEFILNRATFMLLYCMDLQLQVLSPSIHSEHF